MDRSTNTLVVLHAGALRHPLREIARLFMQSCPEADIRLETSGSLACARRLVAGEQADLVALADPLLFERLLIPSGLIRRYFVFAVDEIVISYDDFSRHNRRLTAADWIDVLLDPEVTFGRSDHNLDPCGYRTLFVWQLAERYYGRPGLYALLNQKCGPGQIYPKSIDLGAAILDGRLDYAFQYQSVARHSGLRLLRLPEKINLSNPAYAAYYAQAAVALDGPHPVFQTEVRGAPVEFAVAQTETARNPETAAAFLNVLISRTGQQILEQFGLVPY